MKKIKPKQQKHRDLDTEDLFSYFKLYLNSFCVVVVVFFVIRKNNKINKIIKEIIIIMKKKSCVVVVVEINKIKI